MRTDNNLKPHMDGDKQSRRVKLTAVRAKITWIGKLSYSDREALLMAVNKEQ